MNYEHGLFYGTSAVHQLIARKAAQPMVYDVADTTQMKKLEEEAGL